MNLLAIARYLAIRCHIDSERGASLVEYALLVGLIAIVCLVAIMFLGSSTSTGWPLRYTSAPFCTPSKLIFTSLPCQSAGTSKLTRYRPIALSGLLKVAGEKPAISQLAGTFSSFHVPSSR